MEAFLEWWSPTTGYCPTELKRDWVWVRAMGIPLSLWSQNIFTKIGNFYGSFIEMEEESCLKNHLQWARIKDKGDSRKGSNKVKNL